MFNHAFSKLLPTICTGRVAGTFTKPEERSKESALKPGRIRKLEKSQGNLEKSCHHYEKWQNQGENFQWQGHWGRLWGWMGAVDLSSSITTINFKIQIHCPHPALKLPAMPLPLKILSLFSIS